MARVSDPRGDAEPPPVVWREGDRVVVALRGQQDAGTADAFAVALASASELDDGDVVVDVTDVRFLAAATMAVIVRACRDLAPRSRHVVVRGPSGFVRRVLEAGGLAGLIEASDTGTGIGSCATLRGPWSPPDGDPDPDGDGDAPSAA